jgi:hypothetical protein
MQYRSKLYEAHTIILNFPRMSFAQLSPWSANLSRQLKPYLIKSEGFTTERSKTWKEIVPSSKYYEVQGFQNRESKKQKKFQKDILWLVSAQNNP